MRSNSCWRSAASRRMSATLLATFPRCILTSSHHSDERMIRHAMLPNTTHRGALICTKRFSSSSSSSSSVDHPSSSRTAASAVVEEIYATLHTVDDAFVHLLDDRRRTYRDDVLLEHLQPLRTQMAHQLCRLSGDESPHLRNKQHEGATTPEEVAVLRRVWQRERPNSSEMDLYVALMSSALITTEADVRWLMMEVEERGGSAAMYAAVLRSLPFVCLTSSSTSSESSTMMKCMDRTMLGNLSGFYFGRALARHDDASSSSNAPLVDASVWQAFFTLCAIAQTTPKLMDQWWSRYTDFYTTHAAHASTSEAQPLPLHATHSILSWAAKQRDVERALTYFRTANERGLIATASSSSSSSRVYAPGFLSSKHKTLDDQQEQLRFLAKLLSTGKTLRLDGGLKEMVLKDLQRLTDAQTLTRAPWGVVNDVLSGLDMQSAMRLLKMCGDARGGDGEIPFMLWAALLRRCCQDHHVEEAESLFTFIRQRFSLSAMHKRELVEIMLRMYATLSPSDFPSALALFHDHVHQHPPTEPVVVADVELYTLLARAADSRNAAMMIFLEACAEGVGMSADMFEALLAAHPHAAMSSLSRKLPHDYTSSSLDAQLRIPANVDAHLRREEAQRLRGKEVLDSTGGT